MTAYTRITTWLPFVTDNGQMACRTACEMSAVQDDPQIASTGLLVFHGYDTQMLLECQDCFCGVACLKAGYM